MSSRWIAITALFLLCPVTGLSCDFSERYQCKDAISQLVSYRSEAIEYAFGNVFGALPRQIEIKFVRTGEEEYERFTGRVAYDAGEHVLVVPQRFLTSQMPTPLRWAAAYWPYYRKHQYQELFPLIAAIDNALWGAVMQESARSQGLTWPHAGCGSIDMGKRLPCEMLIAGVAALVTSNQAIIFNSNAIERIWPEQFSSFADRSWRSERDYYNVQRYGGILLLRPLFSEFGASSTLAYVAQTPFTVEDDNMRASALRYQARAREALQNKPAAHAHELSEAAAPLVVPRNTGSRYVSFGEVSDGG